MPLISAEDFFEPQISQITLIFNKLQIEQIAQKLLMRKRMNFHRLADAKRHSRAGGNLLIYSTNFLRIYSLPPWRNMFFETADCADCADFFLPQMPLISAEDF